MLSERLHELIDKGLVVKLATETRKNSARYTLSAKGRSLGTVLQELYTWGANNAAAFGVQVDEPLKRMGYRQ